MKSSRRLSKIFRVLLIGISVAFAMFLLQAGSLVIESLPEIGVRTSINDFIDRQKVDQIDDRIRNLKSELELFNIELNALKARDKGVKRQFDLEKDHYKSVLSSRYVTEDDAENKEVGLSRKKLEVERAKLKSIRAAITAIEVKVTNKENEIRGQKLDRQNIYDAAEKIKKDKDKWNTLKAFAVRLAFVIPLLIIAGFLFKKHRKSKYWPFVYGWGYFSLYAFFFELVPYFPSYGGYVRSFVGIILCIIVGRFIIQKLQAYIEQKQLLEKEDESLRRSKLQDKESNLEMAFEKINKKICPSCDRKFVDENNKYCAYCGLCIRKKCSSCNAIQISFNQFCLECGVKQEKGVDG